MNKTYDFGTNAWTTGTWDDNTTIYDMRGNIIQPSATPMIEPLGFEYADMTKYKYYEQVYQYSKMAQMIRILPFDSDEVYEEVEEKDAIDQFLEEDTI